MNWDGTSVNFEYANKLSKKIRYGIRSILEKSKLTSSLRKIYSGLGSCLLYHRVIDDGNIPIVYTPHIGLSVTQSTFFNHIKYLKHNFECIDLTTAIKLLDEDKLPKRSIIITFDDGYEDNKSNALPILEHFDVPCTIFVTTGLIENTANLWWFEQEFIIGQINYIELDLKNSDIKIRQRIGSYQEKYILLNQLNQIFKSISPEEQLELMAEMRKMVTSKYSYKNQFLSWSDIKELSDHKLVTIGAHTIDHLVLATLPPDRLYQEIYTSKDIIENKIQKVVHHFAYPFGSKAQAGSREFEACKQAGYMSAFTTRFGHIQHGHRQYVHSLPRIAVDYHDNVKQLSWKLSGINSMVSQFGKRVITD